ncbi:MAG TPA: hypothetical protein VF292_06545 [Rhodanobacteraceae bacterium]
MSGTLYALLPEHRDFRPEQGLQRWLARGDRLPDLADAHRATLRKLFTLDADGLPVAALRHQAHVDAPVEGNWVCADPAYVRSEATGARLMAWPINDLKPVDGSALATALQPLFAETRAQLMIDAPSTWCLQVPAALSAADYTDPRAALGADLLDCLPGGANGRGWRKLFSEAQVVLHAHPVNAAREAAGKVPVNALWFWGAGALPGTITSALHAVIATDPLLRGVARAAGVTCTTSAAGLGDPPGKAGDVLLECNGQGDSVAAATGLAAARKWLRAGRFDTIVVVFAGGERYRVRRVHALRVWRRA